MENAERVLNISYLRSRLIELDLKQWWVAEQMGVDRKTLTRWIHGHVRSTSVKNIQALAKILKCEEQQLTLLSEDALFATPSDQMHAATLLATNQLADRLGPIGDWDIVESLLKATIVPNLPLFILGELFNQLSIASWRRSKIDQASLYAEKAEEIGRRLSDYPILVGALLSRANILSWKGELAQSIALYEECLTYKPFIDEQKFATTLSNLGAVYWEKGIPARAEECQNYALAIYERLGKLMNMSIGHTHLALIALEKRNWEKATEHVHLSLAYAEASDYRRGLAMNGLIEAEILAEIGESESAIERMQESLHTFEKLKIEEGFNFEFAARISRLVGQMTASEDYLKRGMSLAKDYPLERARLFVESGKLAARRGEDASVVREYFEAAAQLFDEVGATPRAQAIRLYLEESGE